MDEKLNKMVNNMNNLSVCEDSPLRYLILRNGRRIAGFRPKTKNISFNSTLNEPDKSNDNVFNDEK